MSVRFDRDVCTNLAQSEAKEWLVTNGIGGYGAGTLSGVLTRRYHGLLIAALQPPLGRILMLSKLNETVTYNNLNYDLYCDRWSDGTIFPHGYDNIAKFFMVGTVPVWQYKLIDAVIEKRIWMQQGENTTYISYTYKSGDLPISLSLDALVNYRNHHGDTHDRNWKMEVESVEAGIKVKAHSNAANLYLFANSPQKLLGAWKPKHAWHHNFALMVEKHRGLIHCEDLLLAGNYTIKLNPGESCTIAASTSPTPNLDGDAAWRERYQYEQQLLTKSWDIQSAGQTPPQWTSTLVLSANQFIVDRPQGRRSAYGHRPTANVAEGKTIIAGYPWSRDWARDTMISLPGLTLTTGRPGIARHILRTFAGYVNRGMLPDVFPDSEASPKYNTVDATLWYFEAVFAYYRHTRDKSLIKELFPILNLIIDNYRQGTRHNIHQDTDGLIYAGESRVQLTWMDAKVGEWVVTPRIGKPVEINALWYNALIIMKRLAQILELPAQKYGLLATMVEIGFKRFWNEQQQCCYDVIDTPNGNDDSIRPNQILAVSLPSPKNTPPLLNPKQRQNIVDLVAQKLLTPYGLRSLDTEHLNYQGIYSGDRPTRDKAYHQGTGWAWLIGHFIQAHLNVYQQPEEAKCLLLPFQEHLNHGCIGTIGEIFDGDSPFMPRGCFAQAWSVAEVLRSWELINNS